MADVDGDLQMAASGDRGDCIKDDGIPGEEPKAYARR
jgi:hypothetical protein